ncbi:hypothetical protein [Sphingobacterium multivorum]|uniref:Uncharacterized protein n=1 Tax=Sphingobacterium multivorum TaxID=28454 RepID=A0A2X2IUI8_SPHMU|nr:hypothetical protein [Sphingobacterium multivorum]QRQ63729.1 hypothetical protein I6J33_12525 [Sphingobacterium multivorum]SPZ85678.1 Uncharacterised protein [Sphingobacterium multivorum]
MKAQIGLVITAVAGAALLVYKRWKQRSVQESTETTDRKQTGNLSNPPSWYRPLKMPDIDSSDIVSLQYAPATVSPDRNDAAQGINKNISYYHKGNRYQ